MDYCLCELEYTHAHTHTHTHTHTDCEMHLVWVHCIKDGGVSPSVCPQYYYAHKVKSVCPSYSAPKHGSVWFPGKEIRLLNGQVSALHNVLAGTQIRLTCDKGFVSDGGNCQPMCLDDGTFEEGCSCVPAPHPPVPPPTWRPPLWASKECDQHVSDEDKYLDKNFVNQEIQHVAGLPSGVKFTAGHLYCKDGVPVPEGKWAVTLPSDDNKLRRKWYKVRLSRRREG